MMNISQALDFGKKNLEGLESPNLESEVILSVLLGTDRVYLKTHKEKILSWKETVIYKKWITKRSKHFPMAYIIGYKIWGDLKILVNPNVLIPRDETEILMEHIVRLEKSLKNQSVVKILDIGTGSGCIALFLKKMFPNAIVSALDLSKAALRVAKDNAKVHQVDLNFLHSDLLEKIPKTFSFDVIVANLPYVPENEAVSLEVFKEPKKAIFSGDNGLETIKRLSVQLKRKQIKYKSLYLEFLPFQKKAISEIFKEMKIDFIDDIGGESFFARITQCSL
ncbi:peptide chain release factor N(5)-glutamine methyltransferase [Candidatus Gracilibacteria bacterium]|nr:peptide chain release factor N(5)-glutamine methyltransferase [Candidatus Gracilibacteria bacterium]